MADKIRVNTGSLTVTRDTVNRQVGNINNQISELNGDIAKLDSMWEGEAHEAFHSAFLADVFQLQKLCKSLESIVSYESNAIKEYNQCEQQVAALIAGINV